MVRLGSDWFGLVRLGQVILIRRVPHAQTEQPSEPEPIRTNPNQAKLIRTNPNQSEQKECRALQVGGGGPDGPDGYGVAGLVCLTLAACHKFLPQSEI